MATEQPLDRLPDELLLSVASNLPPAEALAFSLTNERHNRIVGESLRWQRRCLSDWRYGRAPNYRPNLITQFPLDGRIRRMERVAALGYDAKDLLLRWRDETPDEADDVLAGRFYASAILDLIHRTMAIDTWTRLAEDDAKVSLVDALGMERLWYEKEGVEDPRVSPGEKLARQSRPCSISRLEEQLPFDGTFRAAAHQPATAERGHLLRRRPAPWHISAAVQLSGHVYAVVDLPQYIVGDSLRRPTTGSSVAPGLRMYLDPFNSANEVAATDLARGLWDRRLPAGQVAALMGPTSVTEAPRRAGHNILRSAQSAFHETGGPLAYETYTYVGLWNAVLLGDGHRTRNDALEQSRVYATPLLERLLRHFPQEIGLAEKLYASLFPRGGSSGGGDGVDINDGEGGEGSSGSQEPQQPLHPMDPSLEIAAFREADDQPRMPKSRLADDGSDTMPIVKYRVGQYFEHRRYQYEGIITGWDETCKMPEAWIQQMRVDDLEDGRHQPFYHIIDTHRNSRYVAQENILKLTREPTGDIITKIAGRYFKRWDTEGHVFVSNLKEEYPDD
ncbi:hypothetical protein PG994_005016 [Apiospora phragmitis]|uniref:F-box domain-containing protein n=1 Tax=Apiospora phragmitis TaxID=2905665 RepID=A0ABR1VSC9_9PEZI